MGPARALALLVAVAGCPSHATSTPEQRLAKFLEQGGTAHKLDRATFDSIVVEPFRSLYDDYAKQPLPMLSGPIVVRKQFAGDPALSPSQVRLRWALPVMYPAYVAQGAVFVEVRGDWKTLTGLDEAMLVRVRALDATCAARLDLTGPPGTCTDAGWAIADAALRGGGDRFVRACKLAAPHCPLHGLDELDAAVRELKITRNTAASTGHPTMASVACTKPNYTVRDDMGGFVEIRDKGCHTCTFVAEPDNSPVLDGYAHALRDEPAEFLAAAGLKQISVCSNIEQRGDAELVVGGTIDPQAGGLLLLTGEFDLTGEEVVAHELFHLFDRHPKLLRYASVDEEWPAGGFVNDYARTRVREDHATVYQYMMARPDELCAAAATDSRILKKAQLIRSRIASVIGDVSYLDQRLPCLH
jgi:hypothetical protein